jgi:hypothetical protein
MRRYTGQRALYEAWSLSRSKPKRHGLLERLRPQLEKLHAVANAKLKPAAPPLVRPAVDSEAEVRREDYQQESRETAARPPSLRVEPRPDVPVPVKVEVPAEAHDRSPVPVGGVSSERKETRPPKSKGKGSKNRYTGQSARNTDETVKRETVETVTVVNSPSLPFSDSSVVEEPKTEAPKAEVLSIELPEVEAPKVELPKVEPLKAEEPEPVVEEVKPAPATLSVAEDVKPVTHEPAGQVRSFSDPGSLKQVEQPISTPRIDMGIDVKPLRVGERLKDFRTQRNEQLGLTKDTKPHAGLNLKPRPVQINAGRIEISLPLKYAGLGVLGAVVLLLMVFWLGKASGPSRQSSSPGSVTIKDKNPVTTDPTVVSQGNNRIVIAQAKERAQLVPLMEYFLANDIKTGTMTLSGLRASLTTKGLSTKGLPTGEGFLLMTADLYNSVDKPGTDGYNAKQKIIELGEKYRPTEGTSPFTPESFRKVYGLKVQ